MASSNNEVELGKIVRHYMADLIQNETRKRFKRGDDSIDIEYDITDEFSHIVSREIHGVVKEYLVELERQKQN